MASVRNTHRTTQQAGFLASATEGVCSSLVFRVQSSPNYWSRVFIKHNFHGKDKLSKKWEGKASERAQWSRALAAFAVDLDLVPSTRMVAPNHP